MDCHALCVAIGPTELARLLGYESMFHFPRGVHLMPVRLENGKACFDFVSDEAFEIAGAESLMVLPGHPLPHANLGGYDFSKLEVVKRGPGRKAASDYVTEVSASVAKSLKDARIEQVKRVLNAPPANAPIAGLKYEVRSCDHKPFKRKDGLVVCENCGVRL